MHNNRKANGIDQLSNKMIYILNKYHNKLIPAIINLYLNICTFSEIWKKKKIILLNKPDKESSSSSKPYRSRYLYSLTSEIKIE